MHPSERNFIFAPKKNPNKMSTAVLLKKAKSFLKSKNKKLLLEIIAMFDTKECSNFSPLLMAVEMIFTELLRRKEMCEGTSPLKLADQSPEAVQCRWLREAYETAMGCVISCFKRGETESRTQALVTIWKLVKEEGLSPLNPNHGVVCFPSISVKNIFTALLDDEVSMTPVIERFQEFTEYRDVQQYGLKMISLLAFSHSATCQLSDEMTDAELQSHLANCDQHTRNKPPNQVFICNYLELFSVLMTNGLPKTPRAKNVRHPEDRYLCDREGRVAFTFNPDVARRYVNRCWGYASQWPLQTCEKTLRRALVLLVDRIMPYLSRPQLVLDLLADSLDREYSISVLALSGMMELVTQHRIEYPDIYDRLYSLFEPEMFETRSKKRLMHLAEIFLSSTRISLATVAAFVKRFSRLALTVSPGDATDLLRLISILLLRHAGLQRMITYDEPPVMPKDPYIMEESNTVASRALHSSLWEVAAMRLHFTPEVCLTAIRVLAAVAGLVPPEPPRVCDDQRFDRDFRRRFKTIEMNFVRLPEFAQLTSSERVMRLWDVHDDK